LQAGRGDEITALTLRNAGIPASGWGPWMQWKTNRDGGTDVRNFRVSGGWPPSM